MSDIFISYESKDQLRIIPLVKALESKGWSVWLDEMILPGEVFANVIEKNIIAAKCVIVVWSKNSIYSQWVKTEARFGLKKKKLIPVLIDDVLIPFEFQSIQSANLINWQGASPHPEFEQLVKAISNYTLKIFHTKPKMNFEKTLQM
jgi:hypothetical protein